MLELPYTKSAKLLNADNNAKTVKGIDFGYRTWILYLASHKNSGYNLCSQASVGCSNACLYTAGRGAMSNVQKGRINKARWFMQDRPTFLKQLRKEISNAIRVCKKFGFIPCFRLNGTSDIPWENHGIIQEFPDVQFYDYTKIYKRALQYVNGHLPSNYHITYSLNEDNREEAFEILRLRGNISAVFRNELPKTYGGYNVINADETDLRFTDAFNVICGLKAKGYAKKDYSGFVLD
jgi:hypothetical protein|tara:strand:+ start:238 stop:945 length:708 start_codon:yes stop_codon:yes gene_type:complete